MKYTIDNHEHDYDQVTDTCNKCWLMRSTIESHTPHKPKSEEINLQVTKVEEMDWEKEFNKKFVCGGTGYHYIECCECMTNELGTEARNLIRQAIAQSVAQEREWIAKRLKEKK